MTDTLGLIDKALCDDFTPEVRRWIRNAIRKSISEGDSNSLAQNLQLTGFRNGWVLEYQRQQWLGLIRQCHALLGGTEWSAASVIAKEIERQSRSSRPPDTPLAELIAEALDTHPGCPKTAEGVYQALMRT